MLSSLKPPEGSHKRRKILGRGSGTGHGKTSTRGSKGQTSRTGRDFYTGFEGGQTPLIRRIPKRGFTNKFRKEFQIVNLDDLNRIKEETITPELMETKGLIKDRDRWIKVLGEGKIQNGVTVQAHAFSKKAAQEIKNAGGQAQVIHV
ncbi:MAG: 50S ribosomal protein L15 [Candidatus Omnitrophota bacterium]